MGQAETPVLNVSYSQPSLTDRKAVVRLPRLRVDGQDERFQQAGVGGGIVRLYCWPILFPAITNE
jgi:hypothetical protein